jgi:glucan phosphoethanolaminetransferase (alkaline phosphatase superfamily)
MEEFDVVGFMWRLLFAMALVLLTFNPTGHSYYHWLADGFPAVQPLEAVAGILLLIGWVFFVRSTLAAMGMLGVGLMAALFAAIVWWMVSQGWLDVANRSAMAWVLLLILGLILGVGMSWSHIRRRLSGQASVDRVDE